MLTHADSGSSTLVDVARKDDVGRRGEECAAIFLTNAGYRLIERNWRCPQGEVDLIVEHEGQIVFVEVKSRSSVAFGHPFEAITIEKLARIRRLAASWCDQSQTSPRRIRIDAIAVIAPFASSPTIEHLTGIF